MVSEKTVDYWDQRRTDRDKRKTGEVRPANFWEHPTALRLYRDIAFHDIVRPWEQPALRLLRRKVGEGELKTGLSIGCGAGEKELFIIHSGMVETMTLIEVVPSLIADAKARSAAQGMSDKVSLICGDFWDQDFQPNTFDLIYFDNALHHMSDVSRLLARCCALLRPGGVFLMDDFVGPTYNQFSPEVYDYADFVRGLLPPSCFDGEQRIARKLGRLPIEAYLASDPSEAIDSASILPSIGRHMAGAEIIPTGGLCYYLAARGAYCQFSPRDDRDLSILSLLFELDKAVTRQRPEFTCYALCYWRKPTNWKPSVISEDWKELIAWPEWVASVPDNALDASGLHSVRSADPAGQT